MRPAKNDIYTAFINHQACILTETDRQHLHAARGFTDEIIDDARLRSCRPGNLEIIEALQGQFTRNDLIDAGILAVVAGQVQPNEMLLQPRVLIPYLCENGTDVYHLRPHKLGFKNVPVQYYCAGQHAEHVVLTESEFKAVASYAYGHHAAGIPGISSFAREHFARLTSYLVAEGVHRVTVCFDNEIKNDPALPNYKPEAEKRWDTQYYSTLMAKRIAENCSIETSIATLPAAWMINGKIDIDGALAAGHTQEEFEAVIAGALRPGDYVDSLPEEGREQVMRKLRAFELSLVVRRQHRGYEVARTRNNEVSWNQVCDVTMDIVSRISTGDEIVRDVRFQFRDGQESEIVRVSPADMVTPDQFQKFLYSSGKGDGVFTGSKDDLQLVWALEHARAKNAVVYEPDHVGHIRGKDMWIFGNSSIINGQIVMPDENGVFWNGKAGYKAPRYTDDPEAAALVGDGSSRWTDRMPNPATKDFAGVNLREIAQKIFDNFGGLDHDGGYNALLAFAWSLACAYSDDIFEHFSCFPLLWLCGPKESGKSTLARWMLRLHGVMSPGFNMDGATVVGVNRTVSYYASIPTFMDEVRTSALTNTGKDTLLRSIYDRQPVVKGVKDGSNTTRALIIRSPVMLAGEHVPGDPALKTRCLQPILSAERKNFGCEFQWLDKHSKTTFPRVLPFILLHGPAAGTVVDKAQKWCDSISARFGARVARNYGTAMAAFQCLVDENDEMNFLKWASQQTQRTHEEQREDDDLSLLWEDLPKLRDMGVIQVGKQYELRGQEFFLAWRQVWEEWERTQKQLPNRNPISSVTALKILQQKKWLVKYNHPHRFGGGVMKCVVIKLDKEAGTPRALMEFAVPGSVGV